MAPDRKKAIAAMLIARPMGSEEAGSHDDAMPQPGEGHMQAAKDMMEALKNDDAEEFAHALHAYICMFEEQPHNEYDHEQD